MSKHFFKGSVHGTYVKKFSDYAYRKPIIPELEPIGIEIDPEPGFRYVELVDYEVSFYEDRKFTLAQVWLMNNEYTTAKKPKMLLEFTLHNPCDVNDLVDTALRLAFGGVENEL